MKNVGKGGSGGGGVSIGGGGGGGGSSSSTASIAADADYLGVYADYIEDNNLIAILGLDKDLAAAIEEYDEYYSKLEDTRDALEQLYQQVVSVWDELANAPLEEADRQIE